MNFDNPLLAFFVFLLVIWTFIWKGMALWHSARNNQINWFMLFLLINTMGILPIIYLKFFQKKIKE